MELRCSGSAGWLTPNSAASAPQHTTAHNPMAASMVARASCRLPLLSALRSSTAAAPSRRLAHRGSGAVRSVSASTPHHLHRRWLSGSSGVSPEHYEILGATPHQTAAELQAAYAAACDKVPRGGLAVLELAKLSEALSATMLVAPLTNTGQGDQSWRAAGEKAAGGLALPTGLKAETEDDADKRVNLAMQKAMAYKRAKAAGAADPKAAAEAELNAASTTPAQAAEQAEAELAQENAQEEADATPRWVELTREIDENRPRIIAKLKESVEAAAKLGMLKPRLAAIADAEEDFRQSVRFHNADVDDMNLQAPLP